MVLSNFYKDDNFRELIFAQGVPTAELTLINRFIAV